MGSWIRETVAFSSCRRKLRSSPRSDSVEVDAQVVCPLRISGLLISAEEILYDATDWWRWVIKLLCRHGLHSNYEAIYPVWRRDFLDAVNRHEIEYWPAFCQFLRAVGCSSAQISELLVAAMPRRRQFESEIRRLPDVRSSLRSLRAMGIRLAVVSCAPSPSDHVVERLQRVGLGDDFDQVVTAWELKSAASDPQLYRTIAARWNLRHERLAMIGQNPVEVAAAAVAGMTPISCVRSYEAWNQVRVDHLGCVPSLLEPLGLRVAG